MITVLLICDNDKNDHGHSTVGLVEIQCTVFWFALFSCISKEMVLFVVAFILAVFIQEYMILC